MAAAVLLFFSAALVLCVVFDVSILWALAFGGVLFFCYGLWRGRGAKRLFAAAWRSVKKIRNVLIALTLVGMLTASWRLSGTAAFIVYYAAGRISPGVFLAAAFALCALFSLLTGTAFGTAGTCGVILMTAGRMLGISPVLCGGAILAGGYFGDRASPVSSSALLVSEITGTDLFSNVKKMLCSAALPFCVTCGLYVLLGLRTRGAAGDLFSMLDVFPKNFSLHWTALVPALVLVVMAIFRVNMRVTMAASIVSAAAVALILQHVSAGELFRALFFGFASADPELGAMMNGGGIASMLRVLLIVCLSSTYAGLFEETGLLDGVDRFQSRLAEKLTAHGGALLTALVCSAVACNQTLTIMLTDTLCKKTIPDDQTRAMMLENTAVVAAPMIPWSIASGAPLAAAGAGPLAIAAAFYLPVQIVCSLIAAIVREKRRK